MRIKRITIKNFRTFKDLVTLDFEENYTVLVGKNGVGKTSILEAINLATSFSFTESKIKPDDFNLDTEPIEIEIEFDNYFFLKIADWIRLPSKKIKFVAKYRDRSSPGKAFSTIFTIKHIVIPECYQKYDELKPALTSTQYVPLKVQFNSDTRNYEYWVKSKDKFNELQERLLEVYNTDSLDNFPRIFYFSKERDRDLKPGYFTTFQKILDELNWRFFKDYKTSEREEFINKWEEIYKFIIDKVNDPKQKKIISPLKDKVKEFLGEKFSNLEISLFNLKQPFTEAFFALRKEKDDKIITLSRMASGELMIIAYFLLKLTSELSKEEIIFLIDDSELHLHPQLQYKLFNEIKSSQFQHILTTHSDIFIDVSRWRSIKRLDQFNNIFPIKAELDKILEDKQTRVHLDEIKKWHQHQSIFFREDNQLFFADKCLLVEGPAEKYGLPVLANKLDNAFKEITIISCNGKSKIPYYQLLCKSFGIPYFTLFDLDNHERNMSEEELMQRKKVNERIKNWSMNGIFYYSFESSFEKLLNISNSGHKTSETLIKIDGINKEEVPQEIGEAISKINNFVKE